MSFLLNLQLNRARLKPTETIVTQQDGQKFLESNCRFEKLNEVSAGYVIDTKPDDIPAKITDYIYLGSQDCCDSTVLAKFNLTHVLSVGVEAPMKISNVTYKFVKMLDLDRTRLEKYLEGCINFINCGVNSSENVLIHCNAGVSRSASVVIAYLILQNSLTFDSAYAIVKKARPCIRPNDGFMAQLRQLKGFI